MKYHFASDNAAGAAPEAWAALEAANPGYELAYGEDSWTEKASNLIRDFFETDCEVFFTFNGTATNSLALSSICLSYHSLVCHEQAHIETYECGAPAFYSNGAKVLLVDGDEAKVDIDEVKKVVVQRSDLHYPKPKAISITQPTEMGTLYSLNEIDALRQLANEHSLKLHMDGARLANAIVALDVGPKEITWQCGVDVLSLGGTKSGTPVGDVVVFFNKELAYEFEYRCKQAGQLASKMRFLAAPWVGLLESGAFLKYARHANECAANLTEQLSQFPGMDFVVPTQTNGVFVQLPGEVHAFMRGEKDWGYHVYPDGVGARLMCSWCTSDEDIEGFVGGVREFFEDKAG